MISSKLALRLAARAPLVRQMPTSAAKDGGHHVNPDLWQKITLFVCIPCIAMSMVNTYLAHLEHAKHPRPEFVPYEYMYVRKNRYPWGDGVRSFFHNPYTNALPDGYETEDPHKH